jgi:hypothetical protein
VIDVEVVSDSQYMLVILRQRTRADNVAIITGLSRINIDNAYDTGSAGFNRDATCLVKFVPDMVSYRHR